MWNRGHFGEYQSNKSALFDAWTQTGMRNTPFDQKFYLILNVAVGGTNGFFKDVRNRRLHPKMMSETLY